MPTMIAKRALYYGGPRRAGERFEASAEHARMLQAAGKASVEDGDAQVALDEAPAPRRRRYQRRDVRAEA